jgi:hypothetical protein
VWISQGFLPEYIKKKNLPVLFGDDADAGPLSAAAGGGGGGGHAVEVESWVDDEKIDEYLEEMVEEWVMQKLFRFTFSTPPHSKTEDQELSTKIASLSFLNLCHLDVKCSSSRYCPAYNTFVVKYPL